MRAALLTGRGGLGDAIYARPFVREVMRRAPEVYVETSWPALFADLAVRPVKRIGGLAVQAYHGELVPGDVWQTAPEDARRISMRYRWRMLRVRSVVAEMEILSGLHPQPLVLDLPPLPESPLSGPYAVVRPPAIRCDYPAPSREPDPEYLVEAARQLQERGIRVVTLGHFVPGLEEPNGAPLPADVRFEYGELPLMQAISLVAHAALVVSPPCWMVPAAVAARAPLLMIGGGCGGRNNPQALVDARFRSAAVQWLLPADYCMCMRRDHDCPKSIASFGPRLDAAIDALTMSARAA